MKILIVGGTQFVGLAMAREALLRGHDLDLFHRSDSVPAGTEAANHLQGDRTRDFTALQSGSWDVVIDVCGYRPHEIHALYDVFAGRIKKYVFISTVSTYPADTPPGADEDSALISTDKLRAVDPITVPIDAATYGPLKVLCEEAVAEHYPDRLIIRPTYVIGPDDHTKRFTEWVHRIQAGGIVDVPEPADAPFQYIDARDLANFVLDAIEADRQGTFHVAAPSGGMKFGEVLDMVRETVGESAAQLNWIPIEAANLRPGEFPFWAGGKFSGAIQVDTARAAAAGLKVRDLADSIRDVMS